MVLLGQDENNQSAVVVLGDEDQDDKDGDVSAVIGKIRLNFFNQKVIHHFFQARSLPACHQASMLEM